MSATTRPSPTSPARPRKTQLWLRQRDQGSCASARFVREALGRHLRCAPESVHWRTDAQGKPRLHPPTPVEFNLSHDRRFDALAISDDGAVGVDVEFLRERGSLSRIARRCFHPRHAQMLESSGDTDRLQLFYALWVLKEAQLKCVSSTLFGAPRPIFVRAGPDGVSGGRGGQQWLRCREGGQNRFWLRLWRLPEGSLLAVCLDSERAPTVRIRSWPDGRALRLPCVNDLLGHQN